MVDIFISHASDDAALVEAIIQLIEGGIGIRSDQIFCTSLEEQGIPPGVDFKDHIKAQLGEAKIVLAVVSPQYYNSAFCMCELGATWALTKKFVPLLVPPLDHTDLRGSLFGTQVLTIDQSDKLDSMQAVVGTCAMFPEKVLRWNSRKTQFLEKLPGILATLKPVKTLSEKQAEKLKIELKECKQEFENADAEISKLKQQIAELGEAKDRKAVETINNKYLKSSELFSDLLESAQNEIAPLPRVVREALFYEIRGESFSPEYDEWDEQPRHAVEQNLMYSDENIFSVRSEHPKVQKATKALEKLKDFLDHLPVDFPTKEYESKHQDLLDMRSRTFWKRHQLL
jgi:hypothetical protein